MGGAGRSNPGENPRSTRAEIFIACFTAALFLTAVVQAVVYWGQWKIAQRALLDNETPNVRLWFSPLDFNGGQSPEDMMLIHNGGQTTLFNGEVTGDFEIVRTEKDASDTWDKLELMGSQIVMGPNDEQSFTYHFRRLTPDEVNALMARKAAIMVVGKIEYPDPGKRIHNRYACTYFINSGGRFVPQACNTPPQN